jgi:hypothetical protein
MRKLLTILLCLWIAVVPASIFVDAAQAGTSQLMGVGKPPTGGGGGGYVSPSSVKSGAKVWYSCGRGYTGTSGVNACVVCTASDLNCVTVTVGTNGFVPIPTIAGTNCATSPTSCFILTWYDQSGANSCGGSPCDITNANTSQQAKLVIKNGLMCGIGDGSNVNYQKTGFAGISQPFTSSAVAQAAVNTGAQPYAGDGGAVGFYISTNFGFYASTNYNTFTGDTNWHSLQMTATTLPRVVVDSSTSTGGTNAAGTSAHGTTINFFKDQYNLYNGNICEYGLWQPGFSTSDDANMTANQHGTSGYNF